MSDTTHTARCSCGAVSVTVSGTPVFQAVCSCKDCQERTGSAFGMSVYFKDENVVCYSGAPRAYRRISAKHRYLDFHFCPECGVNVYWRTEFLSDGIGIPGILLDSGFAFKPQFAVWGQSLPDFVKWADDAMPVFLQSSYNAQPINKPREESL